MPDGSRQAAAGEAAVGGIVRDPIDVRDRAYEPTLAPLAPQLLPDPLVLDALRDAAAPGGCRGCRARRAPAAGRRWPR